MPKQILVVIGNDPMLEVDISIFRAVNDQTGVTFTQIRGSFQEFKDHLRRIRMQYGFTPNVHIAAHMGDKGIWFHDKMVSPMEMSEALYRVDLAVLAGCESVSLGDLLGNVRRVLTMLPKIDNKDAKDFSHIFWLAVANGFTVEDSYREACEALPAVAEHTYLHSHDFLSRKRKEVP